MDNRWAAKSGTLRIADKALEGVTEVDPLPDTGDRESSTIWPFLFLNKDYIMKIRETY